MIPLCALALAVPPVPTWTEEPIEPLDVHIDRDGSDPLDETREPSEAETAHQRALGQLSLGEPDDAAHGWHSERDLVVSISGDIGHLYYIMATVRGEGLVAHWRQGPIAGENLTTQVPLLLPDDLARPLQDLGTAHLSLKLALTDFEDTPLGQQSLARTHITLEGSRPVGGAPDPRPPETEGDLPPQELQP